VETKYYGRLEVLYWMFWE